jgi:hypothetical protein
MKSQRWDGHLNLGDEVGRFVVEGVPPIDDNHKRDGGDAKT